MNERRRGLMNAAEGGLPSTFQQVEWIGWNKNTYISIPGKISASFPTKFEAGYYNTGAGTYNAHVFNVGNKTGNPVFSFNVKSALGIYNNGTNIDFNSTVIKNKYAVAEITANSDGYIAKVTCNGVEYSGEDSRAPTNWSGKTFRLWHSADNGSMRGRIYYAKVLEQGTLIIDLIPCYRKADGVIGFYDLTDGSFYTNAGTNNFSKGPDV